MGHSESLCNVYNPALKKSDALKPKSTKPVYVPKPSRADATATDDVTNFAPIFPSVPLPNVIHIASQQGPSTNVASDVVIGPQVDLSVTTPTTVPQLNHVHGDSILPATTSAPTAPLIAHEIGFSAMLVKEVPGSNDDVPEIFYEQIVPLSTDSPHAVSGSALGPQPSALTFPSVRKVVSASKLDMHTASWV